MNEDCEIEQQRRRMFIRRSIVVAVAGAAVIASIKPALAASVITNTSGSFDSLTIVNNVVVGGTVDGIDIAGLAVEVDKKLALAGGVMTGQLDLNLPLMMAETTTPVAVADHIKLYGKADGLLYLQDGAGNEQALGFNDKSYGVTWDESADTYVRTGVLVSAANGASPTAALIPIQAAMRRCLLKDSGVVGYYLDPTDSTLKVGGGASVLTGADGEVMVEIPAFYYKYGYAGTAHTWEISQTPSAGFSLHPAFIKNGSFVPYRYIGAYEGSMYDASAAAMVPSANIIDNMYAAGDILCSRSGQYPKVNETRAEFRGMAAQRGAGWRQQDYDLISAVQLLYLIEYASFYSQSVIGMGRTELAGGTWVADSYIGQCGKSNAKGNGTFSVGGNTNDAYMTYRGIENFWGNVWKWVDGININTNVPYVSNTDTNFADDTAANYTALGITLGATSGWQATLEQISRGFLPASVGGTASASVKITDYYWQAAGWRVFFMGGDAYHGAYAGAFYVGAGNGAADADVNLSGRLAF